MAEGTGLIEEGKRKELESFNREMEEWARLPDTKRGILSEEQIRLLPKLMENALSGTPSNLSPSQRTQKVEIHYRVGRAVRDLTIMVQQGIVRADDRILTRPLFKVETWREEIPVNSLSVIVEMMVRMFGYEYAVPLARAIEEGLTKASDMDETIEVPIIRRLNAPRTHQKKVAKIIQKSKSYED